MRKLFVLLFLVFSITLSIFGITNATKVMAQPPCTSRTLLNTSRCDQQWDKYKQGYQHCVENAAQWFWKNYDCSSEALEKLNKSCEGCERTYKKQTQKSHLEEKESITLPDTDASVPAIFCSAETFDDTFIYIEQSPVILAQRKDPCPGGLTCMTYFCGGTDKNPYVCCPAGHPYLNHCNCRCYDSSNFDCGSYSKCTRY